MKQKKALIVLPRATLGAFFGGAQVQATNTAKFLHRFGFHTDISDSILSKELLSKYSVVHIFDHSDAFFSSVNAKLAQKKIVFTPIYWPEEARRGTFQKVLTYLSLGKPEFIYNQIRKPYSMSFYIMWRALPEWTKPLKKVFRTLWLYPFQAAHILIANSMKEKDVLAKIIGNEIAAKTDVVYNGVDEEVYGKSFGQDIRELFPRKYGIKDYVLSIGRIEPRKNQLRLVKACKKLNLRCVLVGRIYDRFYAKKVFHEFKSLRTNHRYLEYLGNASNMLISAYLNARIVALPSTLETPGLVALEAASLGRTVVVTDIGSTTEYFGDNAYYVNPNDQDGIQKVLLDAWNKPFGEDRLRNYILDRYTWKKAASEIGRLYQKLINDKN